METVWTDIPVNNELSTIESEYLFKRFILNLQIQDLCSPNNYNSTFIHG